MPQNFAGFLEVTAHLERYFQFSVCNFVNTDRTPTTYISMEYLWKYLNDGEKLVKNLCL